MDEKKRQIAGTLKCPVYSCWFFFVMHFFFMALFHGYYGKYIDLGDIIIDVVLLFSIEAIAVLLTLSNSKNNYKLFITSLIISVINLLIILSSIFIYTFSFFLIDNKVNEFLNPDDWVNKEKWLWLGASLIAIKVLEIFPLFIIIIYKKKMDSPLGTIVPQNPDDKLLADEDDILN